MARRCELCRRECEAAKHAYWLLHRRRARAVELPGLNLAVATCRSWVTPPQGAGAPHGIPICARHCAPGPMPICTQCQPVLFDGWQTEGETAEQLTLF